LGQTRKSLTVHFLHYYSQVIARLLILPAISYLSMHPLTLIPLTVDPNYTLAFP
jgi:hypothetical protein